MDAEQDPITQIMAIVQQIGNATLVDQVQQQLKQLQPARQQQSQPVQPAQQNQGWGGNQNQNY